MFCPKCRTEYREGFFKCADCEIMLVANLPLEPPATRAKHSGRSFVEVFRHDQPFVSQMVLDELARRKIACFMQEGSITGIEQSPVCPVASPGIEYVVYVHHTKLQQAQKIVDDLPIDRELLGLSWKKANTPKRRRALKLYWALIVSNALISVIFMLSTCANNLGK